MELFNIDDFIIFIQKILRDYASLSDENISLLTSKDVRYIYINAFTSKNFDKVHNYELLEFLGDGIVNSVAAWYEHRKFKDIKDEGTLTKLKHFYISKHTLGTLAKNLGFWKYVRTKNKDFVSFDILSDVFEAFIGALVTITDIKKYMHTGYGLCYILISKLLDTVKVDFKELKNPKSLLLEIYQRLKKRGLDMNFVSTSIQTEQGLKYDTKVIGDVIINNVIHKNFLLGTRSDFKKSIAEKFAAKKALEWLKKNMLRYL